jgi:hypothetical protein
MEELSVFLPYKGNHGYCSVVLEAVEDYDFSIWHSFFGMAGSHNDINMLQRSPMFSKLVEGHAPPYAIMRSRATNIPKATI